MEIQDDEMFSILPKTILKQNAKNFNQVFFSLEKKENMCCLEKARVEINDKSNDLHITKKHV